MSKQDQYTMCERKGRFATRQLAEMRRQLMRKRGSTYARIYKCPYCGMYHVSTHAWSDKMKDVAV